MSSSLSSHSSHSDKHAKGRTALILCIDFDSYFASCEQHFNPNLRGKPIGVTATNGRTCVIAASREAKRYGVKTGSRTFDAVRMCPAIKFVGADFDRYLEITKKFLEICNRYSPTVELFSLDELFMDVTHVIHLYPTVLHLVEDIKKTIACEIGETITVTIGASYNKLLAKLGSGLDKPDGFTLITPENLDEIYARIPMSEVCGIGDRLEKRLQILGVKTLLDLRKYDEDKLRRHFGNVCSAHLKNISYGRDASVVTHFRNNDENVKSVGRNYCLARNETDKQKIKEILYELCEEIARKLRRHEMSARTVGLSLRGSKNMNRRKTIGRYINTGQDLFEVCMFLYEGWSWGDDYVRQVSIWASGLRDVDDLTYSLFENNRKTDVLRAVDEINDKYGGKVVRNGFLTRADKLPTKPNGFMADKWERKKIAGM